MNRYPNQILIVPLLLIALTSCETIPVEDEPDSKPSGEKAQVQTNITPKATPPKIEKPRPGQPRRINQEVIDEWLASNRYSKALDSLENIPEQQRSKSDREQIIRIKALAEEYDKRQSEAVERLYAQGERDAALKLLKISFDNYPDGTRLYYVKEKIEKEMADYIQNLDSQLLIVKGEWLLQSNPLLQEMSNVKPGDKQVELSLKTNEEEIRRIADRLTALGIHAMSAGRFDQADRSLNMANTLRPSSDNLTALARLDQLRHEEKIRKRQLSQAREEKRRRDKTKKLVQSQKRKQEQLEKATDKLIENVKLSMAKGNLVVAQAQFKQLKKLGIHNTAIDDLQDSLDRAVSARVDNILEKGGELYSNGSIEEAVTLWKTALEIDPDNTIVNRRVKRASQVLSRLRELQHRESNAAQ